MIALNQETTNGMGFVIMGTKVLHYVEKPETYVSNIINVGAYLSSTEVFKHMAQAFNEHHKNESAIHVNRFYLSLFCKYNRDRLTTNFEDDATILGQRLTNKISNDDFQQVLLDVKSVLWIGVSR
ncbi:uncharacterized protein [Dysidea avara]|uniref:uncharacterized protein isoform X5 n=1 Tax=Dysidea avara TaxID=196820 RepID=UPI00332D9E76